jgi:PTS system nitrogen regulatory IIA component
LAYRTFVLKEAAEYLHISVADIEKLVKNREIPVETRGKQFIFRKNDIDEWASKRILGFNSRQLSDYHKVTSVKTAPLSPGIAVISRLIAKESVAIGLSSKTKPSLLRDIVSLAEKSGFLLNAKDLLQSLIERENMCSTAMPDGFALLHPRHHNPYIFSESFIAFGRTICSIPFGAPDGKETDIYFLICSQNDRLHLHVLARLCLMCREKGFLHKLRQAADGQEVFDVIRKQELEIIKRVH